MQSGLAARSFGSGIDSILRGHPTCWADMLANRTSGLDMFKINVNS